ncbi:hypothetical protein V8F33_011455 [Rhypophila sp. PSN 637]
MSFEIQVFWWIHIYLHASFSPTNSIFHPSRLSLGFIFSSISTKVNSRWVRKHLNHNPCSTTTKMPDEHPTTIVLVQSVPERVIACIDDIIRLDMDWGEQVLLTLEQVLKFEDPEATPSHEQITRHFDLVFKNGWSTILPIPRPPKIRDITLDDLKVYPMGSMTASQRSRHPTPPPPHRREGARAFAIAGHCEAEDDSGAKRFGITDLIVDSQGKRVDPWFLLIGIGHAYEFKFRRDALLRWKKVVLNRIDTWNRDLAGFKTRQLLYELVGRDPEYKPEEEDEEELGQASSEKNIPPPQRRPPPPPPRLPLPIALAHEIMRKKEANLTFFKSERCICQFVDSLVKDQECGFLNDTHYMQRLFQ